MASRSDDEGDSNYHEGWGELTADLGWEPRAVEVDAFGRGEKIDKTVPFLSSLPLTVHSMIYLIDFLCHKPGHKLSLWC